MKNVQLASQVLEGNKEEQKNIMAVKPQNEVMAENPLFQSETNKKFFCLLGLNKELSATERKINRFEKGLEKEEDKDELKKINSEYSDLLVKRIELQEKIAPLKSETSTISQTTQKRIELYFIHTQGKGVLKMDGFFKQEYVFATSKLMKSLYSVMSDFVKGSNPTPQQTKAIKQELQLVFDVLAGEWSSDSLSYKRIINANTTHVRLLMSVILELQQTSGNDEFDMGIEVTSKKFKDFSSYIHRLAGALIQNKKELKVGSISPTVEQEIEKVMKQQAVSIKEEKKENKN